MLKFLITIFLITTSFIGEGQDAFYKYKKVADQLINKSFDTSLIHFIKCKDFYLNLPDGSMTSSYPSYEKFKLEKEKVSQITFTYIFFSPTLHNPFSFTLTLDSKKKPIYKKAPFENVPTCVRLNEACDFITKDSALKIAVNDSIKYLDNISITLENAPQTDKFYWVVLGQPKQKPVKRTRPSSRWVSIDHRYINAETGEIISRQKFYENI